jgi:hypothetical protein
VGCGFGRSRTAGAISHKPCTRTRRAIF